MLSRRLACLACLVLVGVLGYGPQVRADATHVDLVRTASGGWQLMRDGNPYFVKGAGGQKNAAKLDAVVHAGGNSIRTYGANKALPEILDAAQARGLTVTVGINLRKATGDKYSDPGWVAKQKERARQVILKYKDHPAVLMWGIGNEVQTGGSGGGNPDVWKAINDIARMAHELDPDHPTMTALTGLCCDRVAAIKKYATDVDIIGINNYAGGTGVARRYDKGLLDKPFMLTEFGPTIWRHLHRNAFGARLDQTSFEKANFYRQTYNTAIDPAAHDHSLGSYAFYWGTAGNAVAPQYRGMFLPTGEKLAAVDEMTRQWTGHEPDNHAPKTSAISLSKGPGQRRESDQLAPGELLHAWVAALDRDHDVLDVAWELNESSLDWPRGGSDKLAQPVPGAVIHTGSQPGTDPMITNYFATVRMPDTPGIYRLYVFAYDGKGAAAYSNIPLRVALAGARGEAGVALADGSDFTARGSISGEAGGTGPEAWSDGGHGGVGVLLAGGDLTNRGRISGGDGGRGGETWSDGGTGGTGVSLDGGDAINHGTISGGDGGVGSGYGSGGDGGIGVRLRAGALVNPGTISGGDGDAGPGAGIFGDGGVGIVAGSNVTIVNSGTISGGSSGAGDRAYAIAFRGGSNRLELHDGFVIHGVVDATTGTGDTLVLGGDADAVFALSAIGTSAQYRGFETFNKAGGSTWMVMGANAVRFQGAVVESGGLILDDATLDTQNLGVRAGGWLGVSGTGRVTGDVTVADGTLVGTTGATLELGSLTLGADSIVTVGLGAPSGVALFDIDGDLTLDGAILVSDADGFGPGLYRLMDYAGHLTDNTLALGPITSTLFLDWRLTYDAGHVYLDVLRNDVSFCEVAATGNQCATGRGAESTGAGSPVHSAIATLSDADMARAAFDALSGESYASTRTALLQDSRFVREAMNRRLHRADTVRDDSAAIGDTAGTFWTHAWGHWGSADGDGNAADTKANGSGLLVGIDAPLGDQLRGGLTAGVGETSVDVAARHSDANSRNVHLGVYLGGMWDCWKVGGGVAGSWHDITSHRTSSLVLPGRLTADYQGHTLQAFVESGYRIAMAHGSVESYVNITHVALHTDDVDERGTAAALHSDRETTRVTYGTLGLHGLWHLSGKGATRISAYGTLGWRHAFGDTAAVAQNRFANGEGFTVAGASWARNALMVQAGIDFAVGQHTSFRVGYSGMLAEHAKDHAAKMSLQIAF